MMQHQVVSPSEWLPLRKQLLVKEKELTRLRDQLAAERRALPWVKVEKSYVFDGPDGKETFADLFGRHSQLIVKHFMFGPGWSEGCVGCSFEVDHIDAILVHLAQRDVSYVAVSRAPLPEIAAFKERMGWHVKWVSSFASDRLPCFLQAGRHCQRPGLLQLRNTQDRGRGAVWPQRLLQRHER